MKKITLTLTAILMFLCSVNAQNSEKEKAEKYLQAKGEITFTFQAPNNMDIEKLTKNMSIINYDASTKIVKAWANTSQFRNFETKNIAYQVPKSENEVEEVLIYDVRPLASRSSTVANRISAATLTFPVGSYPTYAEYAQQMQDFENDYPALVEKVSIGATSQGDKELLFVKISDNVSTDEQEPKLMLTSSMHGDEIAGYPMMLSLIDYILTVYSNTGHADHARIKNLVENAEIWINPSANPDGTYNNSPSNVSVVNATRANANGIDLNRNYPDNVAGAHYDGEVYQTETLAFMALADANNFVIAANFHGGTELVNYPFDNARVNEYEHSDGDWFEYIGVEYATNAQTDANSGPSSTPSYSNKSSYMTDDDDWDNPGGLYPNNFIESPGVTHGAEWYRVYGGRQDYMNFYQQCREITIELSDVKILPESSLVDYWYYNRDALLDFLTQGTYGFRGVVLDANTNNPIEDVKVTVVAHDAYGSEVNTDTDGDYYRPIKGGTYSLLFEAPCYQSATISSQSISDGNIVTLSDVLLTPITPSVPSSLSASAIDTDSASLGWTSTGSIFNLRYREVGTTPWNDVLGLTTNSYDITGLTIATNYEFEVRSLCGAVTSAYSTSFSFTTASVTYCASQGNSVADEFISRIQLNSIDNSTGGQSYSDFTNISTTLIVGENYTITVTPTWTGTTYSEGYGVWIDYNGDGTFTSAERVMNQSPTSNISVSATFNIPATVTTGNTRMRVSMRYNTQPNADGCGSYDYGEVEDYTINLFDGLVYSSNVWTPNAPTNLTSSKDVFVEDGIYTVNSDISINNLTVDSAATINVNKGKSISTGGNVINNGEFVLNSDSIEYSSLLVGGTVTGDVKYNRHVNSNVNGNDLVSPPVSGQSFTDFISNNSNILSNTGQTLYLFGPFEKPTNDFQLYSNVESANLDVAKGYRAASTDNQTFMFSGAVTTSALNVPILKVGSGNAKWNLIGNPYTSYIKLADFLTANIAELDTQSVAVYGYDADNANGSVWAIWNLAYSDANPNTLIAPGQGFFVSSKDGGSNISFTPSMRALGSSDDFIVGRTSNSVVHSIVQISSGTQTYGTEFYLTNNATLGLDLGYDAEHFGGAPSDFAIYSELTENSQGLDMAIQSIGFDDIDNDPVIPLGVNVAQGEQITISMVEPISEYSVYLEDALTNTFTLLNTSDYSFTADTDLSDTGRFYLRFAQNTLSVIDSDLYNIQVYSDSNLEQIVVKGQLSEDTKLKLYDIQGREILNKALDSNNNVHTINTSQYTSGIYLVKLSNSLNSMTKKLIIR